MMLNNKYGEPEKMVRLQLFLLGQPRIELDDTQARFDSRKTVALLAYLAVTKERQNRDSLVGMLWPNYSQSSARTSLRHSIYSLNKTLGGECLDIDRESVSLNPDSEVWSDVEEFLSLSQCSSHGHQGDQICSKCIPFLTKAVDLYRDDFLSGFTLKDSVGFDDWQFFQTEFLRRELTKTLDRLVRALSLERNFETAISYTQRWLALDPLDEPAHCILMQLYAWAGERSGALRQYRECERIMREEVDATPLDTTTELYEAIKEGNIPEPPSAPDAVVEEPREEEQRILTALFIDVGEEQAKSDATQPKDRPTNRFFEITSSILSKYGGHIDNIRGESILILFGKERIRESDPELAIRAALEIRSNASRMGLRLTAGVNTGAVYYREMDLEGQKEYLLRGQVVSLAQRLAARSGAGEILAGESIYRRTRDTFDFTPVMLENRGAELPVTAHRVESLLLTPKKARGIEGLRSKLIGRDEELGKLKEALNKSLEGSGQIVCLIGEAGVGKSRLVDELKSVLQENQSLWSKTN